MSIVLNGSSEYLETDTAAVTAYPLTMACWFRSDVVNSFDVLMFIGDKDVNVEYHNLLAHGNVAGDPVGAQTGVSGSFPIADSTSGYSANTWHHACGVWVASNDRRAFIDGGSKGTNTSDFTPTGLDRTSIGRSGDSVPGQYFPGRIAEAAIWDVALSDAQVAMLPHVSPLRVQPANLKGYWPIHGGSLGIDQSGNGLNLTQNGGSVADHAPVGPMFAFAGMDLGFAEAEVTGATPMLGASMVGILGG